MMAPAVDLVVLDILAELRSARPRAQRLLLRLPTLLRHADAPLLIAACGRGSPVDGMRPLTCAGRGGREGEIVDQEIDELLAIDLDRARGLFGRRLGEAERVLRADAGQDLKPFAHLCFCPLLATLLALRAAPMPWMS
jgi:hypothetical protein